MDEKITVHGIEFGDPENPKAIIAFLDKGNQHNQYGIGVYPILDNTGIKLGDEVPFDRIGNLEFVILFRTETSVDTWIEHLKWIKETIRKINTCNNEEQDS